MGFRAEIRDDIKTIKDDIKAIKDDVSHHIKRTDLSEKRLDYVENFNRWFLGLFLASIFGLLIKLFLH